MRLLSNSFAFLYCAPQAASCEDVYSPGMAEAAMLVWAGDFNYRIEGTYDEVCRMAREGAFAQLFAIDQVRGPGGVALVCQYRIL